MASGNLNSSYIDLKNEIKREIFADLLPALENLINGNTEELQNIITVYRSEINDRTKAKNEEKKSAADLLDNQIRSLKIEIEENKAEVRETKEVYENEIGHILDITEEIKDDIKEIDDNIDEVEQYSRRNILVIKKYPESLKENTNHIALHLFRKLGLRNVSYRDICRSHRMTQRKNKKGPAPIYVKLVNHDLKDAILERRHLFRRMPGYQEFYIDENLTRFRSWLFARVRDEVGDKRNCWTYDGTINVRINENPDKSDNYTYYKIRNSKDFYYVFGKRPTSIRQ